MINKIRLGFTQIGNVVVLQTISNFTQGRYGKFFATLLFGLLIASFGIWGMNSGLQDRHSTALVTVNGVSISKQAFHSAYQSQVDLLTRYFNAPPTPEQLESLSIGPQVLVRLVAEILADQQTRSLNMTLPLEAIWASVVRGPNFKDATGQFNKALFEQALRNSGNTKIGFLDGEKRALLRQQLAETLVAGLTPPKSLEQAVHRYVAEERTLQYFTLPLEAAGPTPPPDSSTLEAYFEEHKLNFRAPEYRRVVLLEVSPARLVPPDSLSQGEVRSQYMAQKDTRFTIPERRHVQQVIFSSLEQAQKAYEKIKTGVSFERIVEDNKMSVEDSTLGTALAKTDIVDGKIAEAAFALTPGGVSLPVEGTFGSALVRVLKVLPSEVKPYEAVERILREEISAKRGTALLQERITTIEDQLASAKSLESIGADLNMAPLTIETDIVGRNAKGLLIESIPSLPEILPALFRAHVNSDEEPVRLQNGGFVWFSVTDITSPRDRTLEEVRPMVLKAWETQERSKRLEALAQKLLMRWQKGESPHVLAGAVKSPLEMKRVTRSNELAGKVPAQLVRRAFQASVGQHAVVPVEVDDSESRALFLVKGTSVPPSHAPLEEEARFAEAFPQEFLFDYINSLRAKMDVQLHPQSLTPQEMSFIEKVPFLSASLLKKPS